MTTDLESQLRVESCLSGTRFKSLSAFDRISGVKIHVIITCSKVNIDILPVTGDGSYITDPLRAIGPIASSGIIPSDRQ